MEKNVGNHNKNSDVLILKGMLNNLKDGLNNFELLLKLQFKILACVMRCERKIKSLKKDNANLRSALKKSRLPKEKSLAVKEKIKYNSEV
ncbi:TPA: hypothetical protein R6497_005275, partial [Klebsiella pneumoniae]|nr:hypothetical protein [Klebsiella pneumoniae]